MDVQLGYSGSGNMRRDTDQVPNVWTFSVISQVLLPLVNKETLQEEKEEDVTFSAFHFLLVSIFHNGLLVW